MEGKQFVSIDNLFLINKLYPAWQVDDYFISDLIDNPKELLRLKSFLIDPNASQLIFILLEAKNKENFILVLQESEDQDNVYAMYASDTNTAIPDNKFFLKSIHVISDGELKPLSAARRKYLTDIKSEYYGKLVDDNFLDEFVESPDYSLTRIVDRVLGNSTNLFVNIANIDNDNVYYRKFSVKNLNKKEGYVLLTVTVNGQPITLGTKKIRGVVNYSDKFHKAVDKIKELGYDVVLHEERITKLRDWEQREKLKLSPVLPNV